MLERVPPEQNFVYDLELWRKGKEGREQEWEMRNSIWHFRNVSGVRVGCRWNAGGWASERDQVGRFLFRTL